MNCFQKFALSLSGFFYPSVVYGAENIPESGALIVGNHLSNLDSVFVRRLFKGDGVFILAKKELFKNKLLGKILSSFGAIPVNRDNPDMKTLLSAVNVLRRDQKLVIFPEGKRNKTGKTWLLPFKGGSFVLAAKSKKPVVPLVVLKKAKMFRKTPVIIGKPFELSEFYDKKLSDEDIAKMEKIVAAKLFELKNELEGILLREKSERKKKKRRGGGKSASRQGKTASRQKMLTTDAENPRESCTDEKADDDKQRAEYDCFKG